MKTTKLTTASAADALWKTERIILDETTVDLLLSINTHNRTISEPTLRLRKMEMERGTFNWDSPEAGSYMVNDSLTWLMDGQHRLTAIKQLGMYGHYAELRVVPDDKAEAVFENLNRGKFRGAGDVFRAKGLLNVAKLVAPIQIALNFAREPASAQDVTNFVLSRPGYSDAIRVGCRHVSTNAHVDRLFLAGVLNFARRNSIPLSVARNRFDFAINGKSAEGSPMRNLSDLILQARDRQWDKLPACRFAIIASTVYYLERDQCGLPGTKRPKLLGFPGRVCRDGLDPLAIEHFRGGPKFSTMKLWPSGSEVSA